MDSSTETVNWSEFFRTNWERKPAVLHHDAHGQERIESHELLTSMRAAVNDWQASNERSFSIWSNGVLSSEKDDITRFLPNENFQSLADYVAFYSNGGTKSFTYAQNGLHVHNDKLWRWARHFMRDLVTQVGVPTDGLDTDLFVGAYTSTPRGIHTDQASTFMYVVEGVKRMAVWPPNYFLDKNCQIVGSELRKTVLDFDYREALSDAYFLDGKPGDILYWPSTYYHIAVSEDSNGLIPYSAVFNVGVFFGESDLAMLSEVSKAVTAHVLKGFEKVRCYSNVSITSPTEDIEVPTEELEALQKFRKIINSKGIENVLKDKWLSRLSATGFRKPLNKRQYEQLSDDDVIVSDPRFPIYTNANERQIVVYANGHSLNYLQPANIVDVITELNTGKTLSVKEIKQKVRTERVERADQKLGEQLISDLYSCWAVEKLTF